MKKLGFVLILLNVFGYLKSEFLIKKDRVIGLETKCISIMKMDAKLSISTQTKSISQETISLVCNLFFEDPGSGQFDLFEKIFGNACAACYKPQELAIAILNIYVEQGDVTAITLLGNFTKYSKDIKIQGLDLLEAELAKCEKVAQVKYNKGLECFLGGDRMAFRRMLMKEYPQIKEKIDELIQPSLLEKIQECFYKEPEPTKNSTEPCAETVPLIIKKEN